MTFGDLVLVPFSLMWGGFAIFWEYTVIRQGAPLFFVLWGIPFVLVGLYLIVGRFLWDARRRAATFYGVSESRIIIQSVMWPSSRRSVSLRTMTDLSMTERADGSGDIVLVASSSLSGFAWPGRAAHGTPMLEAVPNVREVYRIITDRQAAVGSPTRGWQPER